MRAVVLDRDAEGDAVIARSRPATALAHARGVVDVVADERAGAQADAAVGPARAAECPLGDSISPRDAGGICEATAHVEIAVGERQGSDPGGERPVPGSVRAQCGPGAAVPPGDVVGPGEACGVVEGPAHVEVPAEDRPGRRQHR